MARFLGYPLTMEMFIYGLGVGLVVAAVVAFMLISRISAAKKEGKEETRVRFLRKLENNGILNNKGGDYYRCKRYDSEFEKGDY